MFGLGIATILLFAVVPHAAPFLATVLVFAPPLLLGLS